MEVIDWATFLPLKSQNWNQNPKEISKQIEALNQVLLYISNERNIQPLLPAILENCFNSGAQRNIRQITYLIVKSAATLYELPWDSLYGPISTDIGTSSDPEFQVYAMRMLYLLPIEQTLELLLSQEQAILSAMRGESGKNVQYAFLDALPGILVRLWCGLGAENLKTQDLIREMFKYLVNLVMSADDNLCIYGLSALRVLFEESEIGRIRGLSQELEANGSDEELLMPLIKYICEPLYPNIEQILSRMNALDPRYRFHTLYPAAKLVTLRPESEQILTKFETESLLPMLHHLEKGVVWGAARCLMLIPSHSSTIWIMCNKLLALSLYDKTPASSLLLVSGGLSRLPISQQLSISLKTLEFSCRISAKVDRLSVVLTCLTSLVTLSLQLLESKQNSAIYQLFSQPWFVEIWSQPSTSNFREELLACLVETCLLHRNSNDSWMIIAFEVSDICFRVIDWVCGEGNEERTFAPAYNFMLLEEIGRASKDKPEFAGRLQMSLELLMRRFEQTETNIPSRFSRNLALLMLAKFWTPSSEEDLRRILSIVRLELFSSEMLGFISASMTVTTAQSLEFLLTSCLHFYLRYSGRIGDDIIRILTQFSEVVENSATNNPILDLAQKVSGILGRYQSGEVFEVDEFSILMERKINSNIKYTESSFHDYLHAALNIFNKSERRHETLNSDKPMELLRITAIPKEMNWRCLSMNEISGLADPVRVKCTHVIYPPYSLVVFCFRFFNMTKFEIKNIKVQSLLSQNLRFALKQRTSSIIPSISTLGSYEWKVRAIIENSGEISISLLLSIEDSTVPLDQGVQYSSQAYIVPFSDFLLKDISSFGSITQFLSLWTRLNYSHMVQCELTKSIEELCEALSKHMEKAVKTIDSDGFRLGFQAATLQGDRIAIVLTGTKISKTVRSEVRTSSIESHNILGQYLETFLYDISSSILRVLV
ncbi:unnamed protein product [Blepharisma stoltei]|uniref:AP-5 complex subunit beta-1 n=1 Tax=Blepharisma stoltei TaxID=1481888 RepID=A0AAU9K1X3_9CILI|nr:unnamed protein product [Blepharisma stoltei]